MESEKIWEKLQGVREKQGSHKFATIVESWKQQTWKINWKTNSHDGGT